MSFTMPLRRIFSILFVIGAIGVLVFCYSMDYFNFDRPGPTKSFVAKRQMEATSVPTVSGHRNGGRMKLGNKITFVPRRELKPVRDEDRRVVNLDEVFNPRPRSRLAQNEVVQPRHSTPKKRKKPRKPQETERPNPMGGYDPIPRISDRMRLNPKRKKRPTSRRRPSTPRPKPRNLIVDSNSIQAVERSQSVLTTTSRPIITKTEGSPDPMKSRGRPISSNPRKRVSIIQEERNKEIVRKLKPKPTPRPRVCDGCMEHRFRALKTPPQCDPQHPPDLLLLVISSPDKADMRHAIRETWGRPRNGQVKLVFLFGRTKDAASNLIIHDEHRLYNDILQEDFIDSYFNLTYKTMMAFKFVRDSCSKAKYVMKTDDDMWINVDQFFRVVPTVDMADTIGGMCILNAAPIRDPRSKWYASFDAYPESKYPGFCSGTAYFMTGRSAVRIFAVSRDVPFLYLEDVYVSLCAEKAGIRLRPIDGFHNYRVSPGTSWCGYKRDMISSHGVTAEELLHLNHVDC